MGALLLQTKQEVSVSPDIPIQFTFKLSAAFHLRNATRLSLSSIYKSLYPVACLSTIRDSVQQFVEPHSFVHFCCSGGAVRGQISIVDISVLSLDPLAGRQGFFMSCVHEGLHPSYLGTMLNVLFSCDVHVGPIRSRKSATVLSRTMALICYWTLSSHRNEASRPQKEAMHFFSRLGRKYEIMTQGSMHVLTRE